MVGMWFLACGSSICMALETKHVDYNVLYEIKQSRPVLSPIDVEDWIEEVAVYIYHFDDWNY